jgi:hypothetical protein
MFVDVSVTGKPPPKLHFAAAEGSGLVHSDAFVGSNPTVYTNFNLGTQRQI